MRIEDIEVLITLKNNRDRILNLIESLETDPSVEITIVKPFHYSAGYYTMGHMDDDFKAIVINRLREELKETEGKIAEL